MEIKTRKPGNSETWHPNSDTGTEVGAGGIEHGLILVCTGYDDGLVVVTDYVSGQLTL